MKNKPAIVLACALLVYLSPVAFGQETIGDWAVEAPSGEDFVFAAVTNDSGRVLAHSCHFASGDCLWTITISMKCEEDRIYPILINAEQGAEQMHLMCLGPNRVAGQYSYAFTDFDQMDRIVKASGKIAFAVPLEGDEFQVIRFNVKGAEAAISRIWDIAARRFRTPAKTSSTRDRRL